MNMVLPLLLLFVSGNQDEAAIQQMVYEAQEAGMIHHDYDAYMSIWAKEAIIIGGRGVGPDAYDTTLSRDQFSMVRRLQYSVRPIPGRRLVWTNPHVKVEGNRATLSVDVTVSSNGGWEKVSELYSLERQGQDWKVVENRWWMKGWKYDSNESIFSEEKWKELDRVVQQERERGESLELVRAFTAAFRLKEAWELLERLCLSVPRDAGIWIERGYLGMRIGKGKDALSSFQKARELDPSVSLPDYVK